MTATEPTAESRPRKRRWFNFRLAILLVVVLLASLGLSWFALKILKDRLTLQDRPVLLTTADDVARYRGHRYRVWFFDHKTRAAKGFSEAFLRPKESITREPVAGVWMSLELHGPKRQSVSDGTRIVSQYDAIGYSMEVAGYGTEGLASIIWPSLDVMTARGYDGIVFRLPVGPKSAEALAAGLPEEFRGTPEEVEEVLFACLREHKRLFSEYSLAALYDVIGPTRQPARWRELMGDPEFRIRAATVLALAADRDATVALCQKGHPGILLLLPPSAPVLERLVSIIAQDEPLPDTPILGCAPYPDLRCVFVPKLLGKYPRADLLPYAARLIRRAEGCDESWANDLRNYFSGKTPESRPTRD